MNFFFSNQDWYFIIIFSLLISLLTVLPDFYSIFKNEKKWIPVNFPPFIINDEYHYFTILNFVHRRFLNLFLNYKLSFPNLTAISKFQIIAFIFNLPFYHLGFYFKDRRYGVLFVKISNSFFLGIAFFIIFSIIASQMSVEKDFQVIYVAFFSYTFFILLYPGPGRVASIIFNLFNKNFVYEKGQINDLYRAMFSSTSAPLFLLSSAILFYFHSFDNFSILNTAQIFFLNFILFFLYLPIFVIFSLIVIIFGLYNGYYLIFFITLISLLFLLIFYFYKITKDTWCKEILVHTDQKNFFIFNFRTILRVFVIIVPCILLLFFLFINNFFYYGILIFFLGSFSFSYFLKKHQISRFYDRSSCILLQSMTSIFLSIIIFQNYSLINFEIISLINIFFLLLFMTRQSLSLFNKKVTTIDNFIFQKVDFKNFFSNKIFKSRIIATDNYLVSGLIDAFGSDNVLLRHYSVQSSGYKKHLISISLNFFLINYKLKKFLKLFSNNMDLINLLNKRFLNLSDSDFMHHNQSCVQFIACYKDYNNKIISDKMYEASNGWSKKFKKLLEIRFNSFNKKLYKKNKNYFIKIQIY